MTKHAEGKKHTDGVNKRNNFFKVKEAPKIPTADSDEAPGTSSTTNVLELAVNTTDSTVAVIRWVLKCVESGLSGRSCDDLWLLMQTMFPDSHNAQRMQLGKDKFGYIVNHGIFPYLKKCLLNIVKKSDIHVFSFDESLNEATQTCETDVYIRFWNSAENEVKMRYIGSTFFGHGTH